MIPVLNGLTNQLNRQSRGPLAAAGRAGGRLYGEAAGKSAGSGFVGVFQREATDSTSLTRAGTAGGRVYGQSAAREAGVNFASVFQKRIAAPIAAAGQAGGYTFGMTAGDEASSAFAGQFQQGLEGADLLAGAGLADIFQDAVSEGEEAGEETAKGFANGLGSLQGLLAGAGVGSLVKDLVDQASAAEQSVGGVRAVFGEFAAQVEEDSARAAQSLGLSSTAYQELVTVTGALLKNKGLTDYADQADTLVRTGADLAATFGGPTTEAVEALNAALRGESDPIERYAISLNETAVNARLAATGQGKLTGAALDQAKITARLAIIQEQSADAAGAFSREANTQAGQAARSTAAFADLRAELGANLLPAATAITSAFNNDVIPALSGAGNVAADAVRGFIDLPQPIRDAALAFIALRAAAAVGLTASVASAAGGAATAYFALRSRVAATSVAFRSQRASAGLAAASLTAVQTGARGATGALAGLGRTLIPVAAITAGIALFTQLGEAQEEVAAKEQETKTRIDLLTESLNAQNGAITALTRTEVSKALADDGILQKADALGINLKTVTDAALGNARALEEVARAGAEANRAGLDPANYGTDIGNALIRQSDQLREARENFDLLNRSQGESADTTDDAAGKLRDYAEEVKGARDEVTKLILEEKTRREALLLDRQDQLALEEQIRNVRKQAREGAGDGLNIRTGVGGENRGALYDLAEQFNNSSPKVRNADGAYQRIRDTFIQLAGDMGAGERQAKRLADELLRVPRNAPVKFQSEGFKERMAEIRAIEEALRRMQEVATQRITLAPLPELGGLAPGRGGTSPNGAPTTSPRTSDRSRQPAIDLGAGGLNAGGSTYNVYGNINVSDDAEAQRKMRRLGQRANGDGVRRGR